jgi:transposase-like protein
MKRYRQEAREEITKNYQESGLSLQKYCQQHDLSEASLKRWVKEFQNTFSKKPDKEISFVEIPVPKKVLKPGAEYSLPVLTIRFPNGFSIELSAGTEISLVREVLKLVGNIA